jgi:hypothetical protein
MGDDVMEKRTYKEIKSFIEEMGGWDELSDADIEEIRQRVKKMDVNEWQQAYADYYDNPEVMEKLKKKQREKLNL